MNRYHFILSKELLYDLDSDFFRKLKRFLGNFRIEGEDYLDHVIISFYSNEPRKEGDSNQCNIIAQRNNKGSWYFTEINYFKNNENK